jgi:ankyrin repeat protein
LTEGELTGERAESGSPSYRTDASFPYAETQGTLTPHPFLTSAENAALQRLADVRAAAIALGGLHLAEEEGDLTADTGSIAALAIADGALTAAEFALADAVYVKQHLLPLPTAVEAAKTDDVAGSAIPSHPDLLLACARSPLHLAALAGNPGAIDLLLTHGGVPTAPGRLGVHASHFAACRDGPDAASSLAVLIQRCPALLACCDSMAQTPLHYALQTAPESAPPQHGGIRPSNLAAGAGPVDTLVTAGATMAAMDVLGVTPALLLDIAPTAVQTRLRRLGVTTDAPFGRLADVTLADAARTIHALLLEPTGRKLAAFLTALSSKMPSETVAVAVDASFATAVAAAHAAAAPLRLSPLEASGLIRPPSEREMLLRPLPRALLAACLPSAHSLFSHRAPVDSPGPYGLTPFLLCVTHGCIPAARLLLERGASPVVTDPAHNSALHIAAARGNAAALQLSLDAVLRHQASRGGAARAPVGRVLAPALAAANVYGLTPLHLAAFARSPACVRLLLEAGANPHALDFDARAPIHYAAASLSSRASVSGAATPPPLAAADVAAAVASVSLLTRHSLPDLPDEAGVTPLMLAAACGCTPVIAALLTAVPESGAYNDGADELDERPFFNLDHRSADGFAALHAAARAGHLEAVRSLISAGAAVDNGPQPIREEEDAQAFGELVVDETVLPPAPDEAHLTSQELPPLPAAAATRTYTFYARTPMHFACLAGNLEMVKTLYGSGGASLVELGRKWMTPLHFASLSSSAEVVFWLADLVSSLSVAGSADLPDGVSDRRLSVDAENIAGETPLHLAAAAGQVAVARALVRCGADIDHPDVFGQTPLYHCALALGAAVDDWQDSQAALGALSAGAEAEAEADAAAQRAAEGPAAARGETEGVAHARVLAAAREIQIHEAQDRVRFTASQAFQGFLLDVRGVCDRYRHDSLLRVGSSVSEALPVLVPALFDVVDAEEDAAFEPQDAAARDRHLHGTASSATHASPWILRSSPPVASSRPERGAVSQLTVPVSICDPHAPLPPSARSVPLPAAPAALPADLRASGVGVASPEPALVPWSPTIASAWHSRLALANPEQRLQALQETALFLVRRGASIDKPDASGIAPRKLIADAAPEFLPRLSIARDDGRREGFGIPGWRKARAATTAKTAFSAAGAAKLSASSTIPRDAGRGGVDEAAARLAALSERGSVPLSLDSPRARSGSFARAATPTPGTPLVKPSKLGVANASSSRSCTVM